MRIFLSICAGFNLRSALEFATDGRPALAVCLVVVAIACSVQAIRWSEVRP